MSRINRIQNEIKQLEGGKFQKLCTSYLYRKRKWENITELGSMVGTDKTTKGIPDAYLFDNESEKYILIMCGTRMDAINKLNLDVREAIEKTSISRSDIQEIICCHTSSNLSLKQDKELREIAGKIKLTIIGIDTLSHDLLSLSNQDIVRDFLGIRESTEQVWNIDQFVSIHDNSKTNAPLSTRYIDKDDIINSLIESFLNNQIILISGIPGVGKTRLAIEVLKSLPKDTNTFCVKSNNMPVYQDVKDALKDNSVNYLLLDDANTITNFEAVINLLRLEEYERNLKIIITVREYALSDVFEELQNFNLYVHNLSVMNDYQLKNLINSICDCFSPSVLSKIMDLSHNNPRTAVITALMLKGKSYDFNNSNQGFLSSYYKQILEDNKLSQEEKTGLFVLSIKKKLDLSILEPLKEILKFVKLDFDRFLDIIHQLHSKELCNIYQDRAVRVSDQSLSDFVIIDFVANLKKFKVRDFFKELYPKHRIEIAEMINVVNEFENSSEWFEYLNDEIEYVYHKHIAEEDKEDFLAKYGVFMPSESLGYIYKRIQKLDARTTEFLSEKFKIDTDVSDPIIIIICSILNENNIKSIVNLLLMYSQRQQDKVYEIFTAILFNFNVDDNSSDYLRKRFELFAIFVDSIKQEKVDEVASILIANIAKNFLEFSSEIIALDNSTIVGRCTMTDSEYLIQFHELIFKTLSEVYNLGYKKANDIIDGILYYYPVYKRGKGYLKTVISDLGVIQRHFFGDIQNLSMRQDAIVFKLKNELGQSDDTCLFDKFEPTAEQKVYIVFSQPVGLKQLYDTFLDYSDNLLWLFNTLSNYQNDKLLNRSGIEESIILLYTEVELNDKVEILKGLLNSEFNIRCPYDFYMCQLPFDEGRNILKNVQKKIDKGWFLSNLLYCKNRNDSLTNELIGLLEHLDSDNLSSRLNISSFENYLSEDNTILDILFRKYRIGELPTSFFIPNNLTEDGALKIKKLVGISRIKEIYLESLSVRGFDYSLSVFRLLLKESDPDFIYLLLVALNDRRHSSDSVDYYFLFKYFWDMVGIEKAFKMYLEYLISEHESIIYIGVDLFLEKIFRSDVVRSFNFVVKEIIDCESEIIITLLFNLSVEMFDEEQLIYLYELLKNRGISEQNFNNMHLIRSFRSCIDSVVPMLDKDIDFLFKLFEIFDGIEYIPHNQIIAERIYYLKCMKNQELLSDYLDY